MIVLLGGSGFLGSHIRNLLKFRSDVYCPSSSDLNLLSFTETQAFFRGNNIQHVIHCAGFVGGIGLNVAEPDRMYADNLLMGLNLIEALDGGTSHLTLISTICVYPHDAPVPIKEEQLYYGQPAEETRAYGLAKRRLLEIAQTADIDFTYLIPTNLYGPGDHFEDSKSHVVPALIKRAHEAKVKNLPELVVWGDGSNTRDLLFVEDAAMAVIRAATATPTHDWHNISSGTETSIKELAERVVRTVGYTGKLVFDDNKPGGAPKRMLDGSYFNEIFDWRPTVDLDQGLEATYRWYLDSIA